MTIAEYLEYAKKEFAHYFGPNQPGAESDCDLEDMEEEVEYMTGDEVVMSEQEESNHEYTQTIQHLEEKDDVEKWLNAEITKHMREDMKNINEDHFCSDECTGKCSRLNKMVQTRTNDNENGQPNIAAIIAQQLQNIIPQIVTQVTNSMNNNNNNGNNNNRNGGNNRCSYKGFQACGPKEYDGKGGAIALTRWIEKMKNVLDNSGCSENQKVKYAASSFVNKAL
ncbi:hypothetical protein Tco_1296122, partial [Tanacetum coccineum]